MNKKALLDLPGVVGVSDPKDKLIVYVEGEDFIEAVPSVFAGKPVEVKVIGKVRALIDNRKKIRPILGGISISYPAPIAGTLGIVTFDGKILTNAHVIAIDFFKKRWNKKGTPIVQPAVLDGGDPKTDVIGHLEDFVEIKEDGNKVDVAIGTPIVEYKAGEVLGVGKIKGWTDPQPGMEVVKSGRTTGVTKGKIFDASATIKVYGYPVVEKGYAIFEDVVVIEPAISRPGDSGSPLLTSDGYFLGLVFAGSNLVTIACKASNIVSSLKVDLGRYIPPKKVVKTNITHSSGLVVASVLPLVGLIALEEVGEWGCSTRGS